jgi:hypothetical protein
MSRAQRPARRLEFGIAGQAWRLLGSVMHLGEPAAEQVPRFSLTLQRKASTTKDTKVHEGKA